MKTPAQIEAIANADAHLTNAGLASYSELVELLKDAERLGLTFHIGSAYISRAYIDKQAEIVARIDKVFERPAP